MAQFIFLRALSLLIGTASVQIGPYQYLDHETPAESYAASRWGRRSDRTSTITRRETHPYSLSVILRFTLTTGDERFDDLEQKNLKIAIEGGVKGVTVDLDKASAICR